MNWTVWKPLATPSEHQGAATYQVRLLVDYDQPFLMNRMLDTDPDGILCIGETVGMEERRKKFFRALKKPAAHSEGDLLRLLLSYSRLKLLVANPRFEYRFIVQPTEAEAKAEEERLQKRYIRHFGELPPLNSAISDRHNEATWCGLEPWESQRPRP